MNFNNKFELIEFAKSHDDKAKDIINNLYHLKRMGRLYEYMFDENEINFFEQKYGMTLNDYKNYEMNIDLKLEQIKKFNNKIDFLNIIQYIKKRKCLNIEDKFNEELYNELSEIFNLKHIF